MTGLLRTAALLAILLPGCTGKEANLHISNETGQALDVWLAIDGPGGRILEETISLPAVTADHAGSVDRVVAFAQGPHTFELTAGTLRHVQTLQVAGAVTKAYIAIHADRVEVVVQ